MEAGTQQFAESFEAAKVAFADRAGRLDFNAGVASTALHNDINFISVLVAQMVQADPSRMCTRLLFNFAKYKCFQ